MTFPQRGIWSQGILEHPAGMALWKIVYTKLDKYQFTWNGPDFTNDFRLLSPNILILTRKARWLCRDKTRQNGVQLPSPISPPRSWGNRTPPIQKSLKCQWRVFSLQSAYGSPNSLGWKCRRIWRHERGRRKKDLVEGAVTGLPRCQCMSCQDTLDPLIPIGHRPVSCWKDPHPLPLSTCLMRPRCTGPIVFTWPAGARISVGPVILGHKILECHTVLYLE
jgi:hypothetical protein